ncbi:MULTISPECIES: acyl-CoA dehydrogenase family protein [Candidatus Microthrix]|jgi:alkylation response protein AidB-like acyl-CoA dehydrogenase|uniref:Putative Acyl-CoA dehydrogenase domain protein n=1 Tax=Candidatus Neomicrothrix parvicella RN1 TaxID=1229780 RepID=R4Z6M3_9ACTN|nr:MULTISPECIES: acyl-CoA dehydrogenase family protein [Microthrix]MBP7851831.1 acyl-CoA/acyl-ACP dehydrogenase [Candidatus Microthrix sp.]MBP7876956.1 acyl-CoA/acyl-ACP dehydrogenase [Candidatus Microthrix sp.]MBP8955927.1 acyl-CoA/acyl-ACP dehydrogenase [Candidatus Microthrix sp.]MBP9620525.1 acyl-CoA/acyl-ACP dehydrogenase [Candidatus Microthrix sp.]MBP9833608.1 acyl-CoA/acyl-ACP dehydrogenase [Candidatus Microthrix sp.]
MPLDLDLSSEQDMLTEMVAGVADRFSPLTRVRDLEDDPTGYSPELWAQLGELGLIGLLLPEAHGGSGMSMVDAVVVYKELGRNLVPSPHLVSSVLAGGLIARGAGEDQQAQWLPTLASGETVWTVAVQEPGGGFTDAGITTKAVTTDAGFALTGTKRHVFFASAAQHLVVAARAADDRVDLFVVDAGAEGMTLTQQMSIASDTQYQVDLAGTPAVRLGDAGTGWNNWNQTLTEAMILLAAQAVGGADQALKITADYSKERKQFGKALAEFQALSHDMANCRTAVDGAEVLTYEAAWSHDTGRDIAKLAPMAKLFAAKTFRDVTAIGQQIFGGIGFTLEADIQLYFRRAKSLQLNWWDDRHLERLIAAQVLDA